MVDTIDSKSIAFSVEVRILSRAFNKRKKWNSTQIVWKNHIYFFFKMIRTNLISFWLHKIVRFLSIFLFIRKDESFHDSSESTLFCAFPFYLNAVSTLTNFFCKEKNKASIVCFRNFWMPLVGLEPTRPKAPRPQRDTSTIPSQGL